VVPSLNFGPTQPTGGRKGDSVQPKVLFGKTGEISETEFEPRADRTGSDLGGSTGIVAKAIQDNFGGCCLVVDPSPTELAEARKLGLDCEQGLAEQWDPKGRCFDLVLICRSVDHFLSISAVLSKVATILKPGGYIFVDPVDFESCARTMVDYRKMLKIDHVYCLSDWTMRLYLNAAGFDVRACDFGDGTYYVSFLARYTGDVRVPSCPTPYAYEMGQMLRERLALPAPQPYPVDALTRVARSLRSRLRRIKTGTQGRLL
jgi:SAM-dependent methyltransferase